MIGSFSIDVKISFFQINLIHDAQTGKPRGYAFIEYEKESDMHGKWFIKPIALVGNTQIRSRFFFDSILNRSIIFVLKNSKRLWFFFFKYSGE